NMCSNTISSLNKEFDKRLKSYCGPNEITDLWLPYLLAVEEELPDDESGSKILYPLYYKCLEKFQNDQIQIYNKHFLEICLHIARMSVDKGLWYGLFYSKRIGVEYAKFWVEWASYVENSENNYESAWGIYEEGKKFIHDPNEIIEFEKAYCKFEPRLIEWDKTKWESENRSNIKKKSSLMTTDTVTTTEQKAKRRTKTRTTSASDGTSATIVEQKAKRVTRTISTSKEEKIVTVVEVAVVAAKNSSSQQALDSKSSDALPPQPIAPVIIDPMEVEDDDSDMESNYLPECREQVHREYSRLLDMSQTSQLGRKSLINISTIDQVLQRNSLMMIQNQPTLQQIDTFDEDFLNVTAIEVDERDPFDDKIRRQLLENKGINYTQMQHYTKVKTNLPSQLHKEIFLGSDVKIQKVDLGGVTYEFGKKLGEGAYGYVIAARLQKKPNISYACKIQYPPSVWEYYILTELCSRSIRKVGKFDLNLRIPSVHKLIEYNDYSVMFMQRAPQTLLDFANYHISRDRRIPFYYQLYYSIEMLNIFQHMHKLRIIHCDVKPDNFMVLQCPSQINAKQNPYQQMPSLMLIDFNRSIDLNLFDNGTAFVTCVPKKELACVEMLRSRPWIFQHDLFGMVYSIHVLVFLSYMIVCEDVNNPGMMTIKAKFSKHIDPVWQEFFCTFLNIPDCKSNPNLEEWEQRLQKLLQIETKRLKQKDIDYIRVFCDSLERLLSQFEQQQQQQQNQ
ncbi:unnamed protein product, partial [Didymodactylos carnosus]